jgi:hypothetical protein
MNPDATDPNERYDADEMWWPWGNPYEKPDPAQVPTGPLPELPASMAGGKSLGVTDPEELRYTAIRALRWIDLHARRPPANRIPIEDDPVRLNRLMSNIARAMKEREEREQRRQRESD